MVKCFVIAEAGVNHNGSLDMALDLVDAAARAGADAVKFQTFRADRVVARGTGTAEYQKATTGEQDQHELIRKLELSEADHVAIAARCAQRGIEFMSTPFDRWALSLLMRIGMVRIKIPSGEVTNRLFLEEIARQRRPMILSTGMADLDEVTRAIEWIRAIRAADGRETGPEDLTVLHCTSNYPAAAEDVNLAAMDTIAAATGLPVGYSDHSEGTVVAIAAAARGARAIEKHFTLDRSLPGPDHRASLTCDELTAMIAGIRTVEKAIGDGRKVPTETEAPVRALVRRSLFAARDLQAGDRIEADDLDTLRPGTGLGAEHAGEVVGRVARAPIRAGAMLSWDHLM
ncbi:N-acetylneuraminate synthase [Sphingomonas corticis]|uniref:N-acetylneuraminate synthase n=1 Tax=Sphingomonas corticis TaxID=2722791 RepID=UPI001ADDCDD5